LEDSGKHPAGCFYGGPEGQAYWFAVIGCPLEHDGDTGPLWGTPEGAAAAFAHLVAAGLARTDESG
jgi:hypothetical protein